MNERLIWHRCKGIFGCLLIGLKVFFCSIPPSTSRELTDLITRTLKRNPKERIDYIDFFNHPFLKKSN